MRDWKAFIRERIGVGASDEVVSELAAHLEEVFEQAQARGLNERAATEFALQEVDDWRVLAAQIRHAKKGNYVNHRTKSLWLPALATFFGSSVSLVVCQVFGLQPHMVWIGKIGMALYWAWLATLPIFGATGAHLSRRAHGGASARLTAGLSPALIMLIVMCVVLPWGLAIDGFDFFRLVGFGLGVVNWVVIPAVALLLGALPFVSSSRWSAVRVPFGG